MKRASRLSVLALPLLAWCSLAQSAVRCEGEMTGTVNIQKPVYIYIYDHGTGSVNIWTYPRTEPEKLVFKGVAPTSGVSTTYDNGEGNGFAISGSEGRFKSGAGYADVHKIQCFPWSPPNAAAQAASSSVVAPGTSSAASSAHAE